MIVVAAYSLKDGHRKIAHYTVLHEAGDFELMVPEGNYFVCAYHDQNSNLVYDAGEPAGQYGEPKRVAAPAGGVVLEINFGISGREADRLICPMASKSRRTSPGNFSAGRPAQ